MRRFRSCVLWLSGLMLAATPFTVHADPPPDPLRLVPAQADLVAKIENPRSIIETVYSLDVYKDFLKLDALKEALNSTNVRRVNQLIGYYEKKLGVPKYEVLDKIAGGGIVFAAKIQKNPVLLLIMQGKDAKTTEEFVKLTVEVAEQEAARQGSKFKIKKKNYNGIQAFQLNKNLYFATTGSIILASNNTDALKACADMYLGKSKAESILSNKSLAQARKMLPDNQLAWAWLNLESVRAIPQTKEFFETPSKVSQINFTILGGVIDVAGRSPFVCAGLSHHDNTFKYSVRFPKGLKGMPDYVAGYFPKKAKGSSAPLLEPPNVFSSTSFYLDLGKFWDNRKTLLKEGEVKNLEDVDKQSGLFLGGVRMSQLFKMSGSNYRFVVTQPTESVYKSKPTTKLQAYGAVHQMRDPQLATRLDRLIRTGAILATTQFDLKLKEQDYHGVKLVSYLFPDGKELKADVQGIRYNFSPTYTWVNDQFIAASTIELAKDLVDIVKKEKSSGSQDANGSFRSKFYSAGLASLIKAFEDQVVTQFYLGQAMPLKDARQQTQLLIDAVQRMGTAQVETNYSKNRLSIDFTVELGN